METLAGYVEYIRYYNEKTGYTVLGLQTKEEAVCCVGCFFSAPGEGDYITCEGAYVEHPSYGRQFAVKKFEIAKPTGVEEIRRYLASGNIKGIGEALATRIVEEFGEDTLRVLDEEPELFARIKGISARKAREIGAQAFAMRRQRETMLFLQKFELSTELSLKLYQRYGEEITRIIQNNPYRLAEEVERMGFKKADEIAAKVGIRADDDYRIRSGIYYAMQVSMTEGHMCLPLEMLIKRASEILSVSEEVLTDHVMSMVLDGRLVLKRRGSEDFLYTSYGYAVEHNSAVLLQKLFRQSFLNREDLEQDIKMLEKQDGISLDDKQREAVCNAIQCSISVLTGGPGTGKTTTLSTILRYFESVNCDIILTAPTGRAAKRMTEATGRPAVTIHRLLGAGGGEESLFFAYDEENPLEGDVFIVDEMSMVEAPLMYALIKALPSHARLILVGDANQLPSVGPGNVLKDLMKCGSFPVVVLDKIFRQAAESNIVNNAHRILKGDSMDFDNRSGKDFFFVQRSTAREINDELLKMLSSGFADYVGVKREEIQVLTPTRKSDCGVEYLNAILQKRENPPSPVKNEVTRGDVTFRVGDRVMQIKNNYQLQWTVYGRHRIAADGGCGIFNGDMGRIAEIDEMSESLRVIFDENREVVYPFSGLEELELAYAITIHKSQGSEYPAVILPLAGGPEVLLNRNLLYTAITRAKKGVVIIGRKDVFDRMVENDRQQARYSGFDAELQDIFAAVGAGAEP